MLGTHSSPPCSGPQSPLCSQGQLGANHTSSQLPPQVCDLPLGQSIALVTPNPRVAHRKLTFPYNQPGQKAGPKPGNDTDRLQESSCFTGRAHGFCGPIATATAQPHQDHWPRPVSLFLSVHPLSSSFLFSLNHFLCSLFLHKVHLLLHFCRTKHHSTHKSLGFPSLSFSSNSQNKL